jgi:hypothetical protein
VGGLCRRLSVAGSGTAASQTFTVNTATPQQPATQTPVVTPAPKKGCKKIKNRAKRKKCFKKRKQAG